MLSAKKGKKHADILSICGMCECQPKLACLGMMYMTTWPPNRESSQVDISPIHQSRVDLRFKSFKNFSCRFLIKFFVRLFFVIFLLFTYIIAVWSNFCYGTTSDENIVL